MRAAGPAESQPCNFGRPWRAVWFVEQDQHDTAAWASIENVADCTWRADTQVRAVLGEVMAQRRSAGVASDYVAALSPSVRVAGCPTCSSIVGILTDWVGQL